MSDGKYLRTDGNKWSNLNTSTAIIRQRYAQSPLSKTHKWPLTFSFSSTLQNSKMTPSFSFSSALQPSAFLCSSKLITDQPSAFHPTSQMTSNRQLHIHSLKQMTPFFSFSLNSKMTSNLPAAFHLPIASDATPIPTMSAHLTPLSSAKALSNLTRATPGQNLQPKAEQVLEVKPCQRRML